MMEQRTIIFPDLRPLRTVFIGCGAGIYSLHEQAADPARFQIVGMADINEQARGPGRCPQRALFHRLSCAVGRGAAGGGRHHDAPPGPSAHRPGRICCRRACARREAHGHPGGRRRRHDRGSGTRAGRLLAVNFQQRARPEIRAAHDLLQSGALGKLQHANMVVVWPRSRKYFGLSPWRGTWKGEGGGVLLNQAPHNLDLLCYLLGMPARLVAWARTTLHPIETEDTVQAMFEWPGGAIGSLHVSTAESGQPERIEILGTSGRLEITARQPPLRALRPGPARLLRHHRGNLQRAAPAAGRCRAAGHHWAATTTSMRISTLRSRPARRSWRMARRRACRWSWPTGSRCPAGPAMR